MKKLYILLLSVILLAACDPGTGDLFYVDNNSDYNLQVGYQTRYNDTLIVVNSQQKILILEQHGLGTANDRGEEFLIFFDTLYFRINDTLQIDKDYLKRENWDFKITKGNGGLGDGGLSNYTYVLENKDIMELN